MVEKKKAAANKAIADEKAKAEKATAEKKVTFQNACDDAEVKIVYQVAAPGVSASMGAGKVDPVDVGQAGQDASNQVNDSDDMCY